MNLSCRRVLEGGSDILKENLKENTHLLVPRWKCCCENWPLGQWIRWLHVIDDTYRQHRHVFCHGRRTVSIVTFFATVDAQSASSRFLPRYAYSQHRHVFCHGRRTVSIVTFVPCRRETVHRHIFATDLRCWTLAHHSHRTTSRPRQWRLTSTRTAVCVRRLEAVICVGETASPSTRGEACTVDWI